jgi:trimeric autotransporter adhesin
VLGKTQQLLLLGNYSDGTTKFLTESATWSSSATLVATVSSNAGSKGLVTSAGYGTTTITASYGGQTATVTLTVQSPALVSITVSPSMYAIASGTAVQLHATGNYSDNSTLDLTSQVTWSSTNSTVATVSNTSGSQGLATGVNPGTVTITATSGSVQGTATLTVH